MKVCGIQFDIAWEDPVENFRRCDDLLGRAAGEGGQLLVLPEMFATGFSMTSEKNASHEEAIRDYLSAKAKELNLWILGGFVESGKPMPRNVCALFDRSGKERLRYRKLHPFTLAGEDRHFSAGEEIHTLEVEGVRVTPLICYDLRFPEPFRLAAQNTDLFLVIASWPVPRAAHWRCLLRARAIENQCYLLGVNRVGEGGGLEYRGDTTLLDPMGEVLGEDSVKQALVSGEVDPARVAEVRKQFSFLADMREETYRKIAARNRDMSSRNRDIASRKST